MTFLYNPCAPFYDTDMDGSNLQGVRKGMVLEVFILYALYVFALIVGRRGGIYPRK